MRGVAVLLAMRERRGRHESEHEEEEQAAHHRPYARSISARIRSIGYPAFAMRDASSASSRQMSQVAAWPSV